MNPTRSLPIPHSHPSLCSAPTPWLPFQSSATYHDDCNARSVSACENKEEKSLAWFASSVALV